MRRTVGFGVAAVVAVAVVLWLRHDRAAKRDRSAKASLPGRVGQGRVRLERARIAPSWFSQPGARDRRIAGRVVYAGAPVEGARVTLGGQLTSAGAMEEIEVVTGGDGTFDFGEWPAGAWFVNATARGLASDMKRLYLDDPNSRPVPDRLELVLRDCKAGVRGLVEDASGGPIVGAKVTVSGKGREQVETDAQGRYGVCTQPGPVNVHVVAAEYASGTAKVDAYARVTQDFALVPGLAIRGRVVAAADGSPIASSLVLTSDGDSGAKPAVTADDGSFVVDHLRAGTWVIEVTVQHARAEATNVLLAPDGTHDPVVIRMDPAARASGVVLEGDRPVAGAQVMIIGGGQVYSQHDGSFTIGRLAPGNHKLMVNGYELLDPKEIDVVAGVDPKITIHVAAQAVIRGRVQRQGRPVTEGMVRARPTDLAHNMGFSVIEADGSFEVRGLAADTYELYAQSEEAGAFTQGKPVTVTQAQVLEGVVVELDLAASIAGTVVDTQGAPVAGAVVRFQLVGEKDQGVAGTGEDGTFLARGMSGGGEYAVTITAAGSASTYRAPGGGELARVNVPDGSSQITGLRIVVERPSLTIGGKVLRASGAPVADASVAALLPPRELSPRALARTSSAVDGTFTLRELPAGSHRVRAKSGHLTAELDVEAGRSDVVLTIPDPGAIEGTLLGFGANVQVTLAGRASGLERTVQVVDAKFRATDLMPGLYVILVSAGNGSASGSVELQSGQVAQVTLENTGTGRVDGKLVDVRTGQALAGRTCSAGDERVEGSIATTGPDGRFSLVAPIDKGGPIHIVCDTLDWRSELQGMASVQLARGQRVETTVYGLLPRVPPSGSVGIDYMGPDLSIYRLTPGSPAETAGLRKGDIVVAVEGVNMTGVPYSLVLAFINDREAGERVVLGIERDGKRMEVTVTMPAPTPAGRR
jgi:hypothetical protein